ncbi:MAG TPA: hypothetical protein VK826_10065 [Bacteroidia bacterium]|nr:hypothetical protein [Bacteroidia bacterium]
MKHTRYIATLALALPLNLFAQSTTLNLIPNPGFETYSQVPCNCMHGSLSEYIDAWENAGAGTPDYISAKASESCYASPNSSHWDSYGTETPHGGNGMGMIMTSAHDGVYREYLGVTLTAPLKKGHKYYAEFFVTLGDYCGLATNNLGMLFRTGTFATVPEHIITGTPQVNQATIVDQTKGWFKVSGTFVAAEDYTYVIIGNFFTKDETATKTMPKAESYPGEHSYRTSMAAYYIDDFMLREMNTYLTVAGDTVVNIGTTATLIADGGVTYTWADTERPGTIIGGGAELKVTMNKKRSFYVYSGGDTAMITVNIRKPASAYMQQLNGRKVRKGRNVNVSSDEITIQVYDKNEIDGDSISLYYGDSLIVSNLALTKKKVSYTIRVDKTKPRQIVLYAENQGSVPPNTACIVIKDGRNSTDIVLQSDFKYCDSVMLTYKEED